MRQFSFYLYENYDPEREANRPDLPRKVLGAHVNKVCALLTEGKLHPAELEPDFLESLEAIGLLRSSGEGIFFDCPVFLRQDAAALRAVLETQARTCVEKLMECWQEFSACCAKIQNGRSVRENLYHILCGMLFDGLFFYFLSASGAVSTSRVHPTGLDYLLIVYERCAELDALSKSLLCSYNRVSNGKCALQSFGDSRGCRWDFYRFFRGLEENMNSSRYGAEKELLFGLEGDSLEDKKAYVLQQVLSLVQSGRCDRGVEALLERFRYWHNGQFMVPVYLPQHRPVILELETILEEMLGTEIRRALENCAGAGELTAVAHGANPVELANELYHLLFGTINGMLVSKGLVLAPHDYPGEGCYRKSIQIDDW